jgi:chromosome segregation ATPase
LQGDVRTVESSLKVLWEKARRAAALIGELRAERQTLKTRVEELEHVLQQLQQEMTKKENQLKKLIAEKEAVDPKSVALFANGEREALAEKVKNLLAKIDAYL